jgi:hypothetical protein
MRHLSKLLPCVFGLAAFGVADANAVETWLTAERLLDVRSGRWIEQPAVLILDHAQSRRSASAGAGASRHAGWPEHRARPDRHACPSGFRSALQRLQRLAVQ